MYIYAKGETVERYGVEVDVSGMDRDDPFTDMEIDAIAFALASKGGEEKERDDLAPGEEEIPEDELDEVEERAARPGVTTLPQRGRKAFIPIGNGNLDEIDMADAAAARLKVQLAQVKLRRDAIRYHHEARSVVPVSTVKNAYSRIAGALTVHLRSLADRAGEELYGAARAGTCEAFVAQLEDEINSAVKSALQDAEAAINLLGDHARGV